MTTPNDPTRSLPTPAVPSVGDLDTAGPRSVGNVPTTDDAGNIPSAKPMTAAVPGYELLGELGRGGMGVVYKARHLALNRIVALKVVLAGGHASPKARARFMAEAEAVAKLQHPGIVQVSEVATSQGAEGLPYCALEFCPGGSLADVFGRRPQPAKEVARTVEALARAVQHAHAHNIIHRDLKPAQRPGGRGRRGQGDRLRPGEVRRRRRRPDGHGRGDGHAGIHVAGPGARRVARCRAGGRRVGAGRDPVRSVDGHSAVRRRDDGGDVGGGATRRADAVATAGEERAARSGCDRVEVPGEGTAGAVCVGRGARRGFATLASG